MKRLSYDSDNDKYTITEESGIEVGGNEVESKKDTYTDFQKSVSRLI